MRGRQAFASIDPNKSVFLDRDVEFQELRLVNIQLGPPKDTLEERHRVCPSFGFLVMSNTEINVLTQQY